jgi:hypothetical protein
MKRKNTRVNDTSGKIPQTPWQAFFYLFWPLNSLFKKTVFVALIIFGTFFTIWISLPEITKTEVIDYLRGSNKAQFPAIDAHGKESSKTCKEVFDNKQKVIKVQRWSPVAMLVLVMRANTNDLPKPRHDQTKQEQVTSCYLMWLRVCNVGYPERLRSTKVIAIHYR